MWQWLFGKKEEKPKDLDTVCREEIAKYCKENHGPVKDLLTELKHVGAYSITVNPANWEYVEERSTRWSHVEHIYVTSIDSLVAICSVKPTKNSKVYCVEIEKQS